MDKTGADKMRDTATKAKNGDKEAERTLRIICKELTDAAPLHHLLTVARCWYDEVAPAVYREAAQEN
jgi:hypothetical protein